MVKRSKKMVNGRKKMLKRSKKNVEGNVTPQGDCINDLEMVILF